MPFALKHSKLALQISSPRVWSFSGINSIISSRGPAEFTLWQNSAICSISLLSKDSSQAIEYATAECIFNFLFGDVFCLSGGSVFISFCREWYVTDFFA